MPLNTRLSIELCDVGIATDFESRMALSAAFQKGDEGVQAILKQLAVRAYGDTEAWPILLGAWGLLRVMTTIALIEGAFSEGIEDLEDEITEAILVFIGQRLKRKAQKTER